jgi:hypothetical protein
MDKPSEIADPDYYAFNADEPLCYPTLAAKTRARRGWGTQHFVHTCIEDASAFAQEGSSIDFKTSLSQNQKMICKRRTYSPISLTE